MTRVSTFSKPVLSTKKKILYLLHVLTDNAAFVVNFLEYNRMEKRYTHRERVAHKAFLVYLSRCLYIIICTQYQVIDQGATKETSGRDEQN
nr:unnamed protein product [Callosobruchus chinensis]